MGTHFHRSFAQNCRKGKNSTNTDTTPPSLSTGFSEDSYLKLTAIFNFRGVYIPDYGTISNSDNIFHSLGQACVSHIVYRTLCVWRVIILCTSKQFFASVGLHGQKLKHY